MQLMIDILLFEINTLNIFWYSECDGQSLATEVLGQLVENF